MPARNAARPGEGVEDPNRAAARAARGFSGSPGMYQVMSAQTYGRAVFGVWCLVFDGGKPHRILSRGEEKVDGTTRQARPFSDNPGPGGKMPPPWALLLWFAELIKEGDGVPC